MTGGVENCVRRITHVLGQTSLRLSKLRVFRWGGHVARIGRTEACERFWLEYLKGKLCEDLDVSRSIILKPGVWKWSVRA